MSSETSEKVQKEGKQDEKEKMIRILLLVDNRRLHFLVMVCLYILTMCCFGNYTYDATPVEDMPIPLAGIKFGAALGRAGASHLDGFVYGGVHMGASPQHTELEEDIDTKDVEESLGAQMVKGMDESLEKLTAKKPDRSLERMLVHTASMSLETEYGQLNTVTDRIEEIVTGQGNGYIESRSSYVTSYTNRKVAELMLRVDGSKFAEVAHAIERLVKPDMVISVSKSSRDVTEEFVDASARADVQEASREGLKNLMKKAQNISEVLSVRKELNLATEQCESYRNRANVLRSQSKMSTLTVKITERVKEAEPIKPAPKAFLHPIRQIQRAVREICTLLGAVGDTVVYTAVWTIPFLLCFALFGNWLLRLVRRFALMASEQGWELRHVFAPYLGRRQGNY